MHKASRTILSAFAFIFIFISCQDDMDVKLMTVNEVYHCYQADGDWDEERLEEELVGRWEWVYIDYFWVPEEANGLQYKGLEIHFMPDHTLIAIEDGKISQTSAWEVELKDQTLYGLNVEPSIDGLHGRILLCDDLLVFNNSYLDGNDNFFTRVN